MGFAHALPILQIIKSLYLTDPSFPVAGAIEVQTLDWIETRAVSDRTLIEA
jgi:hypothetical protein